MRLYLCGAGAALWAFIMVLGPDPGFTANWPWLALFWALQIGIGLAVLHCVLHLLRRLPKLSTWPAWLLVVVSGVVGSFVLAPVYWLIGEGLMQQALGFPATIDDDDDLAPQLGFGLAVMLREFSDVVGPVTAAWLLISWPRLYGQASPLVAVPQAGVPKPALPPLPNPSESISPEPPAWRAALPRELGDDLIAVSSELQYLRVWTTRGNALVLGSLQDVEDGEGAGGMRVHRSWWVSARHVRSIRRSGDGATCDMSDGRQVPVSRRRKAEVLARFGDGALYEIPPAPPPPSVDLAQNKRLSPT
ncbi:MAG: LytTR family transcriptional regulator [Roseomonas sp.]|nr:LytTR family transcriptional regulator [Roseomonas sp.]MCA3381368.1 LytTR family transcriptional regulator [Roseomonas sp.]